MKKKFVLIVSISVVFVIILTTLLTAGSSAASEKDRHLNNITGQYQFNLLGWEVGALSSEIGQAGKLTPDKNDSALVQKYLDLVAEVTLREQGAIRDSPYFGQIQPELYQEKALLQLQAERILEMQIRDVLDQEGIYNPFIGLPFSFPPVNFKLEKPPYMLIISPRDKIETSRTIMLSPDLTLETIIQIEDETDSLDVSSLVVPIGGMAASFPTFVNENSSLPGIINGAVEEWLHQYLTFRPLGFLYLLDIIGIRDDYDISAVDETVAGIAAQEIGAKVIEKYYPDYALTPTTPQNPSAFNFYEEMRQIRLAVDDYLSRGEVQQAEQYMNEKRDYLQQNGYYIRKLNQAYFAFYGTYTYSPTSVSPIGIKIRELRDRGTSVKDFLDRAQNITSLAELDKLLAPALGTESRGGGIGNYISLAI